MMQFRRRIRTATTAAFVLALTYACGGDKGGTDLQDNPRPGADSISPGFADQGRPTAFALTVNGNDFVPLSVVRVNGIGRQTQYVSSTQLQAILPASDFALFGSLQITVFNPAPGGGVSNVLFLEVITGTSPVPTIANFAPAFVPVGSPATDVVINGTGFVPSSRVVIGFNEKAVTFISATQIRVSFTADELAVGGAIGMRVINPAPGGGISNTAFFEVRTSAPTITTLNPPQTFAGQTGFTLQVTGAGFASTSVVRFDGQPRQTTLTAPGTLSVQLTEADLQSPGSHTITVFNAPPGGGTSNAVTFTVATTAPQITVLPSRGATAGRSGFTLYVHGVGFVPGATVNWNGAARTTTFISGTRLTATITDADVAGSGVASITVVNPGGTASPPVTFSVRPRGATTGTTQTVPLLARDIAYDSVARRIYASVSATSPSNGNSIVAIDPLNGQITGSVFVGSVPGEIALSDDLRTLYVGLDGANAVRRVDLPSLTAGLQWPLGAGEVAGDLAVSPGDGRTVAVSRHVVGISPPLVGVTIYDNGVARANTSPGHTGGMRIEYLESPATLYGYNNAHTGFEFFTIAVDAAGARHLVTSSGLFSGFDTDIVGEAGRIYGTDGSAVDAERRVRIGSFNRRVQAMAIDSKMGRAYLLEGASIHVYDLNTFVLLSSITIPEPRLQFGSTTTLVRWGTDGLAFLDETQLFLVRSPLIGQ